MSKIIIIDTESERPDPPCRCQCPRCKGTGKVRVRDNWDVLLGEFYDSGKYKECPKCGGLGFVYC